MPTNIVDFGVELVLLGTPNSSLVGKYSSISLLNSYLPAIHYLGAFGESFRLDILSIQGGASVSRSTCTYRNPVLCICY